MDIVIFAGKGGVGKSTSAAAYALHQAESSKVLMADYDGGHSLARVLAIDDKDCPPNKLNKTGIRNLSISVIDHMPFEPIADAKALGKTVKQYLSQFDGDYGLIPFCDMITTFFGAPTDVSSVSKFASLIGVYHQSKEQNIGPIILDVEPTAGLERLLNSTESITRSIKNLQNSGWMLLKVLGAKWPDIAAYLKGEYIQNASLYAERINETAKALRTAKYLLVTIPERSPVDQMEDVEQIISSYGGHVLGYVVNNIRGESHESMQVQRIHDMAGRKKVVEIHHDVRLCDSNPQLRRKALKEVGKSFECVVL